MEARRANVERWILSINDTHDTVPHVIESDRFNNQDRWQCKRQKLSENRDRLPTPPHSELPQTAADMAPSRLSDDEISMTLRHQRKHPTKSHHAPAASNNPKRRSGFHPRP
jgi:hypothetical protein